MAVSFVKGMQSKAKSLDCIMPKNPTQIASTELIKFIVISCNIQFVLQLHQLSLKYPVIWLSSSTQSGASTEAFFCPASWPDILTRLAVLRTSSRHTWPLLPPGSNYSSLNISFCFPWFCFYKKRQDVWRNSSHGIRSLVVTLFSWKAESVTLCLTLETYFPPLGSKVCPIKQLF